jgi:hypothetical protein
MEVCLGNLKNRDHSENTGVEKIILKRILIMLERRGTYSSGSGKRHMVGCCGHSNEHLPSVKFRVFVVQLRNCKFLKRNSAYCR